MLVQVSLRNSVAFVKVLPEIVSDSVVIGRRDLQSLLQTWCDGPDRSWLPLGQDLSMQSYVVAFSNDQGRVELNELHPDADGRYSLPQVDAVLAGALRWGQAIGEPTPGNQIALDKALVEVLDSRRLPEDLAELRRLLMTVVGTVYGA